MAIDLLRQALETDDWQPRAACRGRAGEANWFPEEHEAGRPEVRAAKEICAGCPVRVECTVYALLMDERRATGIFGLTAHQRIRLRGVMQRLGFTVNMRTCEGCGERVPAPFRSPMVWCSRRCEAEWAAAHHRGA